MKTLCIISEYNPFHNGHRYQITRAKEELGEDCAVIAIMSGYFVQRGGPAMLSKWSRAKAALLCGVDLVIELPALFATDSAETFARGGVGAAAATGICDYLVFGSESGNINELKSIAVVLSDEPDKYKEIIKSYMDSGLSFPVSRGKALSDYMNNPNAGKILSSPNNILAVEYLKALADKPRITPYTIKREGMPYKSDTLINIHANASCSGDVDCDVNCSGDVNGNDGVDVDVNVNANSNLYDTNDKNINKSGKINYSKNNIEKCSYPSATAIRNYIKEYIGAEHITEKTSEEKIKLANNQGININDRINQTSYSTDFPISQNTNKASCPADFPINQSINPEVFLSQLLKTMPLPSLAVLNHEIMSNMIIKDENAFSNEIITSIIKSQSSDLSRYRGETEGMGNRILRLLNKGSLDDNPNIQNLVNMACSSRHPKSALRRFLFSILLGITKEDQILGQDLSAPFYLRVLGFNQKGRYLLKIMGKKSTLPIITRASDFREISSADAENKKILRTAEIDLISSNIWTMKTKNKIGEDFSASPIYVKNH